MEPGLYEPKEVTQFEHRTIAGRQAYLHQLNAWRDAEKKGRDTRHIGAYSITEAILKVPFGLPRSWRISKRRQYHSVREVRADMLVAGSVQDGDKNEREESEDDALTDEDIPWLKQLARIQFLASGELSEETWYLHLPHNMQSEEYHRKIWDAQREMFRTLCTDKTLALVIYALNTPEFMKGSPDDPTQAMYPFSNWSKRTDFWNALLNRYPMILIFWVSEAFPILDLAFIFGRAPSSHFLDLRTRLKGALRVRAIFGLELVFRTYLNVDPATVNPNNRNASFWRYRSWIGTKIHVAFNNQNTKRGENMVGDNEWPIACDTWHSQRKLKPWSEGVSTPAGEVVEFEFRGAQGEVYQREAFRKTSRLLENVKGKGKVLERDDSKGDDEMVEGDTSEDNGEGDTEDSNENSSAESSRNYMRD